MLSIRRPRRALAAPLLALLLALPAFAPSGAGEAPAPERVLVAVLDTGINSSHPEFAPDQVVAWRDFVANKPYHYDDNSHGTATASLVGGLNVGSCPAAPKVSHAPGVGLIVGKVLEGDGRGGGNIGQAIRWAVAEGADVISISIGIGYGAGGVSVPLPLSATDAISEARAQGVLVVVSAGNGFANAGLAPYPTWFGGYGNDLDALSVGGGTRGGHTYTSTTGNSDPDVTAWSDRVCVAIADGTYYQMSGTSFASPLVAGMAAKLIEVARAEGRSDHPDRIEELLVYNARNWLESPYAREGMGFLSHGELDAAIADVVADTPRHRLILDYDAQGAHAPPDRQYRDIVDVLRRTQVWLS